MVCWGFWEFGGPKNAGLGSKHLGFLESKFELENVESPVGRVYRSENG